MIKICIKELFWKDWEQMFKIIQNEVDYDLNKEKVFFFLMFRETMKF